MLARVRSAVAVTMVIGIFVLAALVLGGLAAAMVWVVRTGTGGGAFIGVLFASAAFVLVMALVRILRATPQIPDGMAVSVMAEPGLWAMVREAAAGVGTRTPEEIRLIVDANAGVTEDSRFLGLVPGVRVLYVGVPLLQTMTRAELLWVLGHEMGHYSERHTALSGVTRRSLVALVQVVAGFGRRNVLRWVFHGYLAVYARVVHAVWRGQELDADRWAATLAGSDVGISALRGLVVTSSSWATFAAQYGSVGTSVGMVPERLFAGYADFLSDPVRSDVDVDRLIADEPRSPFDTHPPTSRRIERLQAMATDAPAGSRGPSDDDEALLVLVDPVRAIEDVEAYFAREGSLTPVPWERAVRLGNRRRDEERAVRVMSAVDVLMSGPGDLSQALYLSAHNRGRQLADMLAGGRALDDEAAASLEREALEVLVRSALVGAGHASYVLRWDRPDVIVDEAGAEVDVAGLVAGVPGNPGSAEWLLEVLRAEGISRTWNPGVSSRVLGPKGPEVLALLVTKQNWRYAHPVVYVTDAGLAIRSLGYREYLSIGAISPQKTPMQLLEHSARFDGLALLRDPATEIVPWDEVEHVTYLDGERPRLTVRRRGGGSKSYRTIALAGSPLEQLAAFNHGRMSLS